MTISLPGTQRAEAPCSLDTIIVVVEGGNGWQWSYRSYRAHAARLSWSLVATDYGDTEPKNVETDWFAAVMFKSVDICPLTERTKTQAGM